MVFPAPASPTGPAFPLARSGLPEVPEVDLDLVTTLADEITTLSAHLHAETHRLLRLIAEFDRLEGWKHEGFASCADWLAYATRLDKGTAREKVRVARALASLPDTSAAMARGELSFSQVRALTRVADANSEEDLLEQARSMSAAALERVVRSWRRLGRADEEELERRRHALRCLSVFPADDGTYVVRGQLGPEVGALLMRAIEAASDALYRGSVPETTPEQRRADALALLAERALTAGFGEGGCPAERYTVVLHADEATLEEEGESGRSELEDGTRVSAETSRRIACDASVVKEGMGRTRVVPPRMRRALELRDRGCRFPGCGSRFTDAHHIRHWADGGPTELDNLVLLCRTHHRLLHEGGFRVRWEGERPLFASPGGSPIPDVPPIMAIDGRPLSMGLTERRWEEDAPLALYLRAVEQLQRT
jgi:hypothetical protein